MAKQRRRKHKTPSKTRNLGRRQRRRRGILDVDAAPRGRPILITTWLRPPTEADCECEICAVLREELGEVPDRVDLSQLSPEGQARIDAVCEPWNPC